LDEPKVIPFVSDGEPAGMAEYVGVDTSNLIKELETLRFLKKLKIFT
jgi:hypothetical protein